MKEPSSVSYPQVHVRSGLPEEFVRQHLRHIFLLIYRLTGNPEHTPELTQEAFIKALQDPNCAKDLNKVARSLPLIAAQTAVNFLRDTGVLDAPAEAFSAGPTGETLGGLPADERINFVLHDAEGLPLRTIAFLLRRPVHAVRASVANARLKLKARWQTRTVS